MKRTDIQEVILHDAEGTEFWLFPKTHWNKAKVVQFLSVLKGSHKSNQIRTGLTHLVFINIDDIDLEPTIVEPVYVLVMNYEKQYLLTDRSFLFRNNTVEKLNLGDALDNDTTNLLFDIKNFAFIPKSNSDFEITVKNINEFLQKMPGNIAETFDVSPLIRSEQINSNVKKLLLDIQGMLAAYMCNSKVYFSEKPESYVQRYSTIITSAFMARAMIEKLILLVALIDSELEYDKIQGSKSIKSSFIKQAGKSKNELTSDLLHYLPNVELLDDNYRTPETHKLGRIFGLLNYDLKVFNSLLNEVSTHFNYANGFFAMILKYLRTLS